MSEWPRVQAQSSNGKLRVVKIAEATYVFEKNDGCDALGVERWRELKFGEAHDVARTLRDYVIELVRERAQE